MREITTGWVLPIGMSPKKIISMKEEIKYATGANYIEIEVHGKRVDITLLYGELPKTIPFKPFDLKDHYKLAVPIGINIEGKLEILDMGSDSHCNLLVGGNPGTGKSTFINGVISTLTRYPPEHVRFVLIDMKLGVELGEWFDIPHTWLKAEDPTLPELKYVLSMIITEIKKRMKMFKSAGVRKLEDWNILYPDQKMNYIFIVIDEFAELKNSEDGKDYEDTIKSIMMIGRAAGARIILATQRPTVDSISGSIKALATDRLAFAVADALNSRVILDKDGAEQIPSDIPGRAIFLTGSTFKEVQVMHYKSENYINSTMLSM